MTTHLTKPKAVPFPLPLAADPNDSSYFDQDGSVQRVDGRHASFCVINQDVPNPSQAVTVHGPMCLSETVISGVGVLGVDGRLGAFFGSLVEPYLRGVYRAPDAAQALGGPGYIRLEVDCPTADGERFDAEMYVNPEQARTIAAGLYQLAADLESRRSAAVEVAQ